MDKKTLVFSEDGKENVVTVKTIIMTVIMIMMMVMMMKKMKTMFIVVIF